MDTFFLKLAAASGFLSVALGAFGAHGLKKILSEKSLAVFHTGVEYQFYHSLALLLVGILVSRAEPGWIKVSGYAFTAGIVLFSGSLYALALTGIGVLGAITPLGGVSFLVGWAALFASLKR